MGVSSTSFKPGVVSANQNVKGRKPTQLDATALARRFTVMSVHGLAEVAGSKYSPAAARVSACTELLRRGWGAPPSAAEMAASMGGSDLSLQHLLAIQFYQGDRPNDMPDAADVDALDRALDEVDPSELGGVDFDTPFEMPSDPASLEEALLHGWLERERQKPVVIEGTGELVTQGLPLFEEAPS